jgi:hypothetical protein
MSKPTSKASLKAMSSKQLHQLYGHFMRESWVRSLTPRQDWLWAQVMRELVRRWDLGSPGQRECYCWVCRPGPVDHGRKRFEEDELLRDEPNFGRPRVWLLEVAYHMSDGDA